MNGNMYRVRKCDRSSDADVLYKMVLELADFENGLKSVEMTADDYRKDAFETKPPLFHAALAEHQDEQEWKPVGYAVWVYSYSTWKGRSFYLEDCTYSLT